MATMAWMLAGIGLALIGLGLYCLARAWTMH
jgi:hypothetical protein